MSEADHDERSFDDSEFADLGPARWPMDPHSLLPRERWLWYEQLWSDVCVLRGRYRLPVRAIGR
jgi:hypothetical protein